MNIPIIRARNCDDLKDQMKQWTQANLDAQSERMRADGVSEDDIAAFADMQRAAFSQMSREVEEFISCLETR